MSVDFQYCEPCSSKAAQLILAAPGGLADCDIGEALKDLEPCGPCRHNKQLIMKLERQIAGFVSEAL